MIKVRALAGELVHRNPLLAYMAAAHVALFVLLIPAMLFDPVQILGISRWIKPMKFAISIAIFLATMGWLLAYLMQRPRAVRIISRTAAFTMMVEMILILTQSARGVESHFNQTSIPDRIIFMVMGMLIIINTVAVIYAARLFYTSPVSLPPAHLEGIRTGFVIFILAGLEAGLMGARNSHSVGLHDGSPGLPFVNWSTGAGDLRVAHFFGLHALQALPISGWLLDTRKVRNGRRWVRLAAAAWLVIMILLVAQALAGRPLMRINT